jgi:hypothetical protein
MHLERYKDSKIWFTLKNCGKVKCEISIYHIRLADSPLLSAQQEKIFAVYATRNPTTLMVWKCIREISSSHAVSN